MKIMMKEGYHKFRQKILSAPATQTGKLILRTEVTKKYSVILGISKA